MEEVTPAPTWLTSGTLRLCAVGLLAFVIVIALASPLSCAAEEPNDARPEIVEAGAEDESEEFTSSSTDESDEGESETNEATSETASTPLVDAVNTVVVGEGGIAGGTRIWTATTPVDARARAGVPTLALDVPVETAIRTDVVQATEIVEADGAETAEDSPVDVHDAEPGCVPLTDADDQAADTRTAKPGATGPGKEDPADAWFADSFDSESSDWQPLSGAWRTADGAYQQVDASGYDFITQLRSRPPSEFAVEVDITATEVLNAGLVLGQPDLGSRGGSTLIDFTAGGKYLRWGVYESGTGQYVYLGGADLADSFDPLMTHRLRVEVRDDRTSLAIDGTEVAIVDPIPDGHLGLVTSMAAAAFDNLVIEDLNG